MNREDDLLQENQALRERLSRLSEASMHINESLDTRVVLQGVIDNARYLTSAKYGVILTMDEAGGMDALLTSRDDGGGAPSDHGNGGRKEALRAF